MTVFKQALANAKLLILILTGCFSASMLLSAYLGFNLYRMPHQLTVYVPRVIPEGGIVLSPGVISDAEVYAFTYYVWQALQTWQHDGGVEYTANIDKLSAYLTPDFRNTLLSEAEALSREGVFLRGHQQTTFSVEGFNADSVKPLSDGVWLVHLSMRTLNRVASLRHEKSFTGSKIASDAQTSFVFKVIRYQYPIAQNPWQLAISGFAVPPQREVIGEESEA